MYNTHPYDCFLASKKESLHPSVLHCNKHVINCGTAAVSVVNPLSVNSYCARDTVHRRCGRRQHSITSVEWGSEPLQSARDDNKTCNQNESYSADDLGPPSHGV